MKKRIASMLAATVLLLSVIALPASAQTDWFGNSDLTTAKVREIADADTLTESQIAEINNHYSEYEIMQGISKTLIEDYAARINPDNPPHCAVCAGFDDLYLHYIDNVYLRLGYDGSNYDIQRGEVLAKRKAESEAAAASQAALEAQEAAESASRAAEEAASKAAQEKAKSEAAAASQNEKDQKKIDEYKSLILRNYANPDGASKGDQSKFFGIADNEEELKLFTRAWREALYETCMGEDPIPSDTSHGTYIKMVDVFSGFVHLYSYYYKLNAEGGVEKWIPYEYNLYRNILVTSSSFDKAFNDTYKGFIKPQSEYPDAYTDTFYISQKLSNSTGNSILDVFNDAFSDGSSEWVGYKGGFFSYNDDACVLVTAKGMSFSESGDYSLTYVESGKTTTLTDSRGFEQEADIYYAYNTDEFSEAYENLNTVDNEIADESSLIFEFLIGNENYTDWQ